MDDGAERAALKTLEGAVGRLLRRVRALDERARSNESRREELEDLLRRITSGDETPAGMHRRVQLLERENEELRRRLGEGREAVERLLAKIRFLEQQQG